MSWYFKVVPHTMEELRKSLDIMAYYDVHYKLEQDAPCIDSFLKFDILAMSEGRNGDLRMAELAFYGMFGPMGCDDKGRPVFERVPKVKFKNLYHIKNQ